MISRRKSCCALLAAALVACGAVVALSPAAAGAVTTECGPDLPDGSGGYRTCTFGDDFNGDRLESANWTPMTTATTGFTAAGECYVGDRAHIRVGSGVLRLRATKSESAERCGQSHWTRYQSGMIFTKDRFAQAYGRFEIRAKMPTGTGLQSAFWMWPQDMAYGHRSGEIDVAEWYGAYPDVVSPTIHMRDLLGFDQPVNTWCRVANAEEAFHTYTVEWEPTRFTFLYDGVPCMTVPGWNPGLFMSYPQPFDKPFFLLLQLALGHNENYVSPSTPFPAKFVVDYIRAWR